MRTTGGVHNNMPKERSDLATETQVGKPQTRRIGRKSRRIITFPTLFLIDLVLETSQNPRERCLDEESNTKTVQNGGLVQKLVNNHDHTD